MDGNRRWAKQNNLTKRDWHQKGFLKMLDIIDFAWKNKVDTISAWCLAKKNIEQRDEQELNDIYEILDDLLEKDLKNKCIQKKVKFDYAWDVFLLPENIWQKLKDLKNITSQFHWWNFILLIWYWGQEQIIRWIEKFIYDNIDYIKTQTNIKQILNEEKFLNYIDTWSFFAPDVIVRTWWHNRHSWCFLYQSEYSEYYFFDKYWPDFDENDFNEVIHFLEHTTRNFGK